MTGKKGRSGGARLGAGAPNTKMILRDGETVHVMMPTVFAAKVSVINRDTVILKLEDGSQIKVLKSS